jgi:indole-3-glycerol phosphate synthase
MMKPQSTFTVVEHVEGQTVRVIKSGIKSYEAACDLVDIQAPSLIPRCMVREEHPKEEKPKSLFEAGLTGKNAGI